MCLFDFGIVPRTGEGLPARRLLNVEYRMFVNIYSNRSVCGDIRAMCKKG